MFTINSYSRKGWAVKMIRGLAQVWQIAKAKLQDIQCSVNPVLNGDSYYTEPEIWQGVGRCGSKSVLEFLDTRDDLPGPDCVLTYRTTGRNNKSSNRLWPKHTCLVSHESFRE